MTLEVTRTQLRDPASVHHRTLGDAWRAFRWARHPQITLGRNVVVKAHVEVRLTDNATLSIGDHCTIDSYAFFLLTKPEPTVELGRYVGIGRHCVVAAKKRIAIGDYTQIGPYCQINDQGHGVARDDLIMNQRAIIEPVTIGRDCWLGSGVRIMKGVTLGDGAVIGAGAIVTKSVPPYEIWAGVPARKIGERK